MLDPGYNQGKETVFVFKAFPTSRGCPSLQGTGGRIQGSVCPTQLSAPKGIDTALFDFTDLHLVILVNI